MNIPDFVYNSYEKGRLVAITDLNQGGISVTNGIERVVDVICKKEGIIDPEKTAWVYKDSDGEWTGWNHLKQSFVHLYADNSRDAMIEMQKRLNR